MELLLFVFTLGYLLQHFGSLLLIRQVLKKQSIEGLSLDTQVCFLIGALSRIFWVFDTRLIYFPLIWLELLLSVISGAYILYLFHRFRHTRFSQTSNFFNMKVLLVFCLIMSFIFHPGAKNKYYLTIQMLVSLTMFLEASGMLPQIYLMRKTGSLEVNTGHYIILLGASRLVRMGFWIMMYLEGDSFLYLIVADLLHTVLLADFVWCYFKKQKGNLIIIA
jgi:ER lumen protein retaining receptor